MMKSLSNVQPWRESGGVKSVLFVVHSVCTFGLGTFGTFGHGNSEGFWGEMR